MGTTAATVMTAKSQCLMWPTSWVMTASSSRSSSRSSRPRVTQMRASRGVRPKVKAFGVPSSTTPSLTSGTPALRHRRATISPRGWSVRYRWPSCSITVAGTSHWMIQGLTRYWTPTITMAKAIGNQTGAPKKNTAAKPTARSRPISPPIEGSDRRNTNPITPSPRPWWPRLATTFHRDNVARPEKVARRRPAARSELAQEADVVGDEVAQVVHVVAHHGAAVDADPEGDPLPLLGVDAHGGEHVRVDHPAAAQLDPARLGAHPAPPALAEDARDLELGGGLGEGEERRPEAGVDVRPEVGGGERFDGAGQVAEGDAPVHGQPLNLVEDGEVAGVGGIPAVAAPRHDHVDGWHLGLHDSDLNRRGVGPKEGGLRLTQPHVEGVPHAAGGVAGRHVEGLEVVPVRLDLRALGHPVAHGHEHVLQLHPGLGDEVEVAPVEPSRHFS